jgi:hypothetical protein
MWLRALRWLAVALAASCLGAYEGCTLMGSLNEPTPGVLDALHAHADPPVPVSPPVARRVVIVVIDGLGADAFDARWRESPLADAPWHVTLDSGVPSRSRPVYHELLTGVPAWASGIRSNVYAKGRADSVADRVRAAGGKVAWMLEEVPWFCDLFCAPGDIVVEGREVESPAAFARVWDAAPALIVVHLVDVDEAGHQHGADSPAYEEASRHAFATVAALRDVTRSKPGANDVLWLVGADHGHTAHGGHGGPEPEVRRVSWIAFSNAPFHADWGAAAVKPMTPVASLAPTIAKVLGILPPRESMTDGLPLLPADLGPPFFADVARVRAVEEARAATDARPLENARSRAILILGVLGATFAGLVGFRRRRGRAEAAVFAIAIAGFLTVGPGLSMSSSRTEIGYLAHGLVTLAIFAGAAWVYARRSASPWVVASVSFVFPILALVAMRGSLGRSDVTPLESVLWPSLGLVPPSVCTAIAVVEAALFGWRHRSGASGPNTMG